jgi:magnesium transporter
VLINCAAYENGRRIQDIPVERIGEWLAREGAFVWVALHDAEPRELEAMQRIFGLHELAVEDVRNGGQRPKIEEYEDTLFAVMHLVGYADGEVECGEVDVFAGRNFVLSVRNRSGQDFLGVRARTEREPHLLSIGPGYVYYALADAVVDRYFPVLDALERELETIESLMFDDTSVKPRELIRRLYKLKQNASELRHAVAPLAAALGKLFGGRVPQVVTHTEAYFRDVHDHLQRIATGVDALRETIGIAIQVNLSMVTIEQSDISKRLAAWAAIFGVLTVLAGIWGMNFEHMPELKWVMGYPAALGLMAVVGGMLYLRFRKAGWL